MLNTTLNNCYYRWGDTVKNLIKKHYADITGLATSGNGRFMRLISGENGLNPTEIMLFSKFYGINPQKLIDESIDVTEREKIENLSQLDYENEIIIGK